MLVSSFGTSTPYAFWGFATIDRIMEVLYGGLHDRIHCLTLQELNAAWEARRGKSVSVTSDRPEFELANLMLSAEFPCIAFLDEPEDAITATMRHRNMTAPDAIRFTTQYFCLLDDVLRTPRVNVFGSATFFRQAAEVIIEIMQIVGPTADSTAVGQVLREAIPNYREGELLTVGEAMARQTAEAWAPGRGISEQSSYDQKLIKIVSDEYRPIFQRKGLTKLAFPKQLFSTSSAASVSKDIVDLCGAARFIVWGPYLFLPVGHWRADVEFEVVDNLSGNEIEADITIGRTVATTGRFELPVMGIYKFCMYFKVTEVKLPVEVRFQTMKGAIEGRMALRSVSINRRSDEMEIEAIIASAEPMGRSLPSPARFPRRLR
jgi:hypothetical protein